MGKIMKFERKAARADRKAGPGEPMPPPGAAEVVEEAPAAPAQSAAVPEPAPAKPAVAPKNPLTQIAAYVKSGDWGRVRAMGRRAVTAGASDQDIDSAIDAALPSVEEAASLPLHQLVAVASAATDQKRQEYFPLIQPHLEHAQSLPEGEQGALADHMKLIGMFGQMPTQENA